MLLQPVKAECHPWSELANAANCQLTRLKNTKKSCTLQVCFSYGEFRLESNGCLYSIQIHCIHWHKATKEFLVVFLCFRYAEMQTGDRWSVAHVIRSHEWCSVRWRWMSVWLLHRSETQFMTWWQQRCIICAVQVNVVEEVPSIFLRIDYGNYWKIMLLSDILHNSLLEEIHCLQETKS